jgi:two-component system, cell cycle sensor histidine kinase and response regulator CckA
MRLAQIFALVGLAATVLIVAEIATWFIHLPGEVLLIRIFRIGFVLFLAFVLCFMIRRKESMLATTGDARASAEQQLRLQAAALEAAANAIIITDSTGKILWVNQAFAKLTGYSIEDAMGNNPRILKSGEHDPDFYRDLWSTIQSGEVWRGEIRNRRKDGSLYIEDMTITPVMSGGLPTNFIGIKHDITEQKKLEAQYRQAQKMEAVGRLAGGVAHDFNNVLSVIIGFCQLSLESLGPGSAVTGNLTRIKSAADRAASLTKQLLTFSRQQVVHPRVINLNEVIERLADMLQRLVGDDVSMSLKLAKPLGSIKADAGQIEQVLMNLAINARDAMPDGGQIVIESQDADLDASYQRKHEPAISGPYVMLSVSDTGCGMNKETIAKIFEPFFTTKEAGRGTGLGLSTVYGIVKQSGGYIWVYSEPQKGTTFKIYLPRITEAPEMIPQPTSVSQSHGHGETILVVEDDGAVRDLLVTALNDANYTVLQAATAQTALQLLNEHSASVQLLLTDIMMPNTSGIQLVTLARSSVPKLKVVFMSGYSSEMLKRHEAVLQQAAYLEKPFTIPGLLSKISAALQE